MQMTLCCATCVGKAANCIYPNKVVVDNAADMESAVAVDHVCATYTGNRRGNSNFIESDVIPMDIDNDHSDNPADWITEDKMEELFGDVDYVLVPSRHHMLAKDGKSERPRYHAYFPIEKCTDAAQYTAMKTAIQKAYPFFDDNALDAARFLFGATTGEVIWHEGWMSIMEVVADTEPDADDGDFDDGFVGGPITEGRSHIFHGADGCWYGIARKTNQKYSYTYRDTEQFDHVSYEFYMDKIENGKCTSQKISVPSGVSDFYSIGMSGKWLMCVSSDSSKLYRLDTTNVANLERVTDYTYNNSNEYSYVVDDDMVINGWYFEDGKPVQKIGSIGYQSYYAWGVNQMARYKTYMIKEWVYSYNGYRNYKDLYLYTPYLATINNLDTPVIKTADKTMKITYTLTETKE